MRITILIILSALSNICYPQFLNNIGWSTYEGKIKKTPIVLSIFSNGKGEVIGDYCYKKYETRIPIKGTYTDDELYLEEYIDNKKSAIFRIKISEEVCVGNWENLATNNEEKVVMHVSSWHADIYESRNELVNYAQKIKRAILTNDNIWLSKNITYPLEVKIANKKMVIKSEKHFLQNATSIFTTKFKKQILNCCICDIFSKNGMTMIASGLIWFDRSIERINN